jgi:hypothetical protein
MECQDSVKNASFFTHFKTKSEFVFFDKDLLERVQTYFLKNPQVVTHMHAYKGEYSDEALWTFPISGVKI